MTENILEITDLCAGYDEKDILQKISLFIKQRSFVGIIGPNGSGKSTFLHVLARSLPVRTGNIALLGNPLQSLSFREFGKNVGYVPQDSDIHFPYLVYDLVMMGRNPHIDRFRSPSAQDHDVVKKALELTHTDDIAMRPITSLSGGERQRGLIARVLAQDPIVLLLDEPFAHIDIHHQYELIRIIRDASQERMAVIAVFHDINLAAAYCDELVLMMDGKIRAWGKTEDILTPELIREVFKIIPIIDVNPITGRPHIYVEEELKARDGHKPWIHVISGGGTGSCLISLLARSGYNFSCGVLSENDSDCRTAKRYGVPTLTEPPFSRISLEKLEQLREMIQKADYVVVTSMPVGWGNLPNIQVLLEVEPEKVIFIVPPSRPIFNDFTGGTATDTVQKLLSDGAMKISNPPELLQMIQSFDPE